MPAVIHFLDVGQGNMALIQAAGLNVVCDCNICDDNEDRVLGELRRLIPAGAQINAFINTHRDADHLRGIRRLDSAFPIERVWDSGAVGSTPDSSEYTEYMRIRRSRENGILPTGHTVALGHTTRIRVLHGATEESPDDCNRESVVFKIEHGGNSVLFPGDCDTVTWKRIVKTNPGYLRSDVLLAPHHGADNCLEDVHNPAAVTTVFSRPRLSGLGGLPAVSRPAVPFSARLNEPEENGAILALLAAAAAAYGPKKYYCGHLGLIQPRLTVVSVGRDNSHGHPCAEALRIYEQFTAGFEDAVRPGERKRVVRTDEMGSIWVNLPDTPHLRWRGVGP